MVLGFDWFGNHFKSSLTALNVPLLYHNPRCSKSRQALALCEASQLDVDVHLYLISPLDYETIHSLLTRLDGEIHQAIRWKDKGFKELESPEVDSTSIDSVAKFLVQHGHLMERPWLDTGTVTRIGRPVELLLGLLE